MLTLLTAALGALASIAPTAPGAGPMSGPDPAAPPKVHLAQSTIGWSGSWIWTPENRKWVDRDNRSSIRLLQGTTAHFCIYQSCWDVQHRERGGIYSFTVPSGGYYEFWFGDFNSLEGRMWLDERRRREAPAAMVRMMRE
ncbi:hypothetical protein ACUN0C_15685 [Faunimonas sp. B44]|uniref:hypothetical protein n=1 Tax=Faunimonas sp. B44 TaxID=3461493 RepID=UPI004044403E